ncbi:MAG: hypothetical protein CUN56_01325 [Phototrophicales bacterium]|nr:MAG: hypothetical protein CUN56_01325 [Phototrophicales bacterium]RMG75209.1 MAG: hypothetical protein D6711_07350 [Chloroflexota bacterium]
MVDFDELRRAADEGYDLEDEDEEIVTEISDSGTTLFLGMTPMERMFISMFLFMNVAILGIALLLATGRIGG